MNNFFELVKVNFKTGTAALGEMGLGQGDKKEKKKKKRGKAGQIALYLVLFAIIATAMGPAGYKLTDVCVRAGLPQIIAAIVSLSLMMISFFYAITVLPGFLFFSDDTEVYLSMPIRAHDLVMARLASALISLYIMIVVMFLPFMVGSLIANFSVQALIGMILAMVLMPIVPYCLLAMIYLGILTAVPKFRDKKRLGLFSSIMSFVFAFVYYFGISFLTNQETPDTLALMTEQAPLYQKLGTFYPPFMGAQWMIASPDLSKAILGFVIVLGITLVVVALTMLVADRTYLRIALSMTSNASSEKQLSRAEVSQTVGHFESPRTVFRKREWKTLFHTSEFLVNAALPSLYLPLLMIAIIVVAASTGAKNEGLALADLGPLFVEDFGQDWAIQWQIGASLGLIMAFYTTASSLAATSVSREGTQISYIRSLPVSAQDFFFGKLWADIWLTAIHIPVLVVICLFFIPFLPVLYLSFVAMDFLALYALSSLEFYLDMRAPRLGWNKPIEAVKNSKGQIIAMVLGLGFFLVCLAVVIMKNESLGSILPIVMVALQALACLSTYLIRKQGQESLDRMEI